MRRELALFSMTILILGGVAGAAVQQGDTEVELIGGWLSESGSGSSDFTSWYVSGDLNYFMSNVLSIGFGGVGTSTQLDGQTTILPVEVGGGTLHAILVEDRDITLYGFGGNAKLHFNPTGKWVPFIGAQVKWVNAQVDSTGTYSAETDVDSGVYSTPMPFKTSTDASGLLWGPVGGVRVELTERNDLVVEAQYHLWTGDIGDMLDNGFGIFFGISHQF